LLADGSAVLGLDNLNSYYDPNLKKAAARPHPAKSFGKTTDVDAVDAMSVTMPNGQSDGELISLAFLSINI
jgi:hypothetical protein